MIIKFFRLSFIFALVLFFSTEIKSQTVQIGAGTNINTITQASPINTYYRRQIAQFVYTKAELNAAGINNANILSELGFYVTNQPVYNIPGYTIKIKHTNKTNVNTALGTTGWTTVKSAFTYSPSPGGYDMIPLDVPFNWNNTQNLAVEICWSQIQPTWDASGQVRIYASNRGYRYTANDYGGSLCGSSPGTRVNYKPQIQLTFKTTSTWLGTTSSNWFTASNWDAGVPARDLDAVIPASAPNMPTINNTGAECKNITIMPTASLTLAGSNNLDVYQDWDNTGTLIYNTGNVTFKGNNINNISSVLPQDFYNLTIDNKNGATISGGSINLHGTLDIGLATGNFNTNNSLTIISDANGTGRIDELTTKCIYTLDMSDTYGDSWNGAFLTVLIDGVIEGTYFALGSNSTSSFIAPSGSTIQLNYSTGNYEFENSYILYDGSNNVIFADGTTPNSGTNVFSTTSSCTFFNPIAGNIEMQRYIDAGATNWRFLTTAVNGATLSDINDDFITSGFIGSDFPNWPSTSNPWPSIYYYDETVAGIQDNGFVAATNTTNGIGVGQGLWVWCGDTIIGTQPFTIDITNTPNVGNISLPLIYTNTGTINEDGWNMVGNPYPSSIDWDSPNIAKNNINNAIYIWNPDLQQFGSYVSGIGTNGGSNNIASSQAFWLQANANSPSATVTEASKTTVDAAFLKPSMIQPFKIKATNSYGTDEIAINIDNNATNNFDANYDALKMTSVNTSLPRLASIIGNNEYAINQFPEQEINIPIKITSDLSSLNVIKFENITALGNASCLLFKDLFTGVEYDLNNTDSLMFYIYDSTTVARFVLKIGATYDINVSNISCFGNTDGAIEFTKNTTTPYDIVWKNYNNDTITNNNVIYSDSIGGLLAGTYYIETTDAVCGNKIDTIIINEPNAIISNYTTVSDTITLGNSFTPNNSSVNATSYFWDFNDGNTSTLFNPNHLFTNVGNYLVNLKAMQNANCFTSYNRLITVQNSTGINEINNEKVKAYISQNDLVIKLNANLYTTIEIRNNLGQTVYNNNIYQNAFTINLSAFSNGVYFVLLTDKKAATTTHKVVYSK